MTGEAVCGWGGCVWLGRLSVCDWHGIYFPGTHMPALPSSSVSTRFPFNLRAVALTCFPCTGFAGFSCSINSY